jgi:membrane-associated PAP2 superfamily phosphatase
MALIAAVVGLLRHYSPVSCPWDLLEYGGRSPDTGRCLPAAHPLVGFSLFGLWLALREQRPQAARYALAAALAIGFAAGAVQVARGAHFVSHVLWTAWIAWAVTLALAAASTSRP